MIKMTRLEALNILENAYGNMVIKGGRSCGKTSLRTALMMAMNALGAVEQIQWERDIAIDQLEEIGVGLGRKMDGKYLTKEEYEELLEYKYMYENLCK